MLFETYSQFNVFLAFIWLGVGVAHMTFFILTNTFKKFALILFFAYLAEYCLFTLCTITI